MIHDSVVYRDVEMGDDLTQGDLSTGPQRFTYAANGMETMVDTTK